MEITILFGVSILLLTLIVALATLHYKTVDILKKEINDLRDITNEANDYLGNALLANIKATKDELNNNTTDLSNALNDIVKEHEIAINSNSERSKANAEGLYSLVKEVKRVERSYKEKINY